MHRDEQGYHRALCEAPGGATYKYVLPDGREFPDPASRYQPDGVHGVSQVVEREFDWNDGSWKGHPLEEFVVYELHVGTFTEGGTFESTIERLDELKDLGVTAVELMPVAQFPGQRNWGYDGAYPFAAQNSYGGPEGLRRLVDACHARGLAAVLDVVYNHLGPEGNYLPVYGPYFTKRYKTPWGDALNFDGEESDHVRHYFVENALHWVTDFHFDALRLDAVHAIADTTARPFLQELAEAVHARARELGRQIFLIAESDLNDPRLIRSPEAGGYGLDAQWSDDFHHALHAMLTGEQRGYYSDFGGIDDMAAAFCETFVYADRYSEHRRRRHGAPARDLAYSRFLAYAQNHDQVGNRMLGERLSTLVNFEQLKLAAAAVLLSPYIPLLFMGEEHGEGAPFLYFTSHSDPDLIEAVRKGRREEFASFSWQGEAPDPHAEETFRRSSVGSARGHGETLRRLYRELIGLRKHPALQSRERDDLSVEVQGETIMLRRRSGVSSATVALNFGKRPAAVGVEGSRLFDSAEARWDGPGSPEGMLAPHSAALFA